MKRETEEQRKARQAKELARRQVEQAKIDAQVQTVQSLLPEGWQATEGFFLSLSGGGSPPHISVCRRIGSFGNELKAASLTDPMERSAWKKQWYQTNREKATEIKTMLESNGYAARQDHGTIYLKLK